MLRLDVISRLPGLVAVALAVAVAFGLSAGIPHVSPLMLALGVGVLLAPSARRSAAMPAGIRFASRTLLRAGVALLGLRIAFGDLATLGASGIVLAVGTIAATAVVTTWLGRRLGVGGDLALLVATGTGICGAAAIAAMEPVVGADEEDVRYAIATVTLFGTLAMLVVPVLGPHVLGLSARATGMWAGASIHEVAQVAGAGAAVSPLALKVATLVKLSRVVLLAPTVAVVSWRRGSGRAGRHGRRPARVPAFVLAFVALACGRSALPLPAPALHAASGAATVLLAAGLAGLGLQVHVARLRAAGPRPLALGLAAWVVAAVTSLALIAIVA